MLSLQNVCKRFTVNGLTTVVADNVSFALEGNQSVALLGKNGAGKSSLLRMIAGTMDPDSGDILTDGTISWPVGFSGNFHPDLTGAQNTRFIARVYGIDTDALVDYVADFSELGRKLDVPLRNYSSGMRSRLAFGISMGIDFDIYLVDEVTSVGDAAFRAKSSQVFKEKMQHRGAIMVSHSIADIRALCDCGMILSAGKVTFYDDLEEAIAMHLKMSGQ